MWVVGSRRARHASDGKRRAMEGGLRGRGRLREHCRLEAVRVQKDVTRVFNLERRVAPVSTGAHTGKWQGLLTPLFPRL